MISESTGKEIRADPDAWELTSCVTSSKKMFSFRTQREHALILWATHTQWLASSNFAYRVSLQNIDMLILKQ